MSAPDPVVEIQPSSVAPTVLSTWGIDIVVFLVEAAIETGAFQVTGSASMIKVVNS